MGTSRAKECQNAVGHRTFLPAVTCSVDQRSRFCRWQTRPEGRNGRVLVEHGVSESGPLTPHLGSPSDILFQSPSSAGFMRVSNCSLLTRLTSLTEMALPCPLNIRFRPIQGSLCRKG